MQPRKVMESTEFGKTEFEKKTFQKALTFLFLLKIIFVIFLFGNQK